MQCLSVFFIFSVGQRAQRRVLSLFHDVVLKTPFGQPLNKIKSASNGTKWIKVELNTCIMYTESIILINIKRTNEERKPWSLPSINWNHKFETANSTLFLERLNKDAQVGHLQGGPFCTSYLLCIASLFSLKHLSLSDILYPSLICLM